jgi:hemerythrin-like domain-containing protein
MTPTRNIAEWIRSEHDRLAGLTRQLHERVAVLPRSNQAAWIAEVSRAFNHVRAHLMKHMALEEQGGYLAGVVELRPALSGEVDRLAHEHIEMARIMSDLARQLDELRAEDQLLIRDTSRRIQNLLQYLEHHEKDENLLILSVFMDDIPAED